MSITRFSHDEFNIILQRNKQCVYDSQFNTDLASM